MRTIVTLPTKWRTMAQLSTILSKDHWAWQCVQLLNINFFILFQVNNDMCGYQLLLKHVASLKEKLTLQNTSRLCARKLIPFGLGGGV
jgi:hypothetical protein